APSSPVELLEEKREAWLKERTHLQKFYYSLIYGTLCCFLVAPPLIFAFYKIVPPATLLYVGLMPLVLLSMIPMFKGNLRILEDKLEDADFEIDLLRYKSTPWQSKAEKLVRINSAQLKRYYDLNLQQNKWMFLLGIGCILLGAALIGVTLFLVVSKLTTT